MSTDTSPKAPPQAPNLGNQQPQPEQHIPLHRRPWVRGVGVAAFVLGGFGFFGSGGESAPEEAAIAPGASVEVNVGGGSATIENPDGQQLTAELDEQGNVVLSEDGANLEEAERALASNEFLGAITDAGGEIIDTYEELHYQQDAEVTIASALEIGAGSMTDTAPIVGAMGEEDMWFIPIEGSDDLYIVSSGSIITKTETNGTEYIGFSARQLQSDGSTVYSPVMVPVATSQYSPTGESELYLPVELDDGRQEVYVAGPDGFKPPIDRTVVVDFNSAAYADANGLDRTEALVGSTGFTVDERNTEPKWAIVKIPPEAIQDMPGALPTNEKSRIDLFS